ncbi:MAG: SRPBCC family protein [Acidimicrobiales bacterium]
MELTNDFTVEVPIEEAWAILTDLERIAPCMPGARLDEAEGEEYRGAVKVKVGPVTAEYRGKATFVERDEDGHRAVLRAEGREARGQGNASATITALLEPQGTATKVSVTTDLTITGRVAQFGRGVLADVSTKLLGQFVTSLEATVLSGSGTGSDSGSDSGSGGSGTPVGPAADGAAAASSPARSAGAAGVSDAAAGGTVGETVNGPGTSSASSADSPAQAATATPAEASVDLVRVVGPALAKRAAPVLGAAVALWAVWRARRRHRR